MRWANLGCQSLNYVTYLRAMNGPCIFQYYPSDENTIKIYFYCLNENKKIKHNKNIILLYKCTTNSDNYVFSIMLVV